MNPRNIISNIIMIFNINSTRGQNAGPRVRSTGNLSSSSKQSLCSTSHIYEIVVFLYTCSCFFQ